MVDFDRETVCVEAHQEENAYQRCVDLRLDAIPIILIKLLLTSEFQPPNFLGVLHTGLALSDVPCGSRSNLLSHISIDIINVRADGTTTNVALVGIVLIPTVCS